MTLLPPRLKNNLFYPANQDTLLLFKKTSGGQVKMGFLFSGIFWGVILILLGISVIINIVFHVHVPFFRIVLALILIYAGVRVLIGGHWGSGRCCSLKTASTVVFSDAVFEKQTGDEYTIAFGKGTMDAGAIFSGDTGRKTIRLNTIFGHSMVSIPKTLTVLVRVNSAFSGVRLPDGSLSTFGQTVYKNEAARTATDPNTIKNIELSVVFGGCEVKER
jgi:predicted membrane protein